MPSTTGLVERYLKDRHSSSPAPPKKPRLRGPLRDLDLDNVLEEPGVETYVEFIGREASVDTRPRHATRSTRNGRADVNYSQKYHPMDEVTRPLRAARNTGSRPPTSFADTSDEEEPELSSGESSDADEPIGASNMPATRTPDPRAVRHSSRTEARKQVNYSKAHHPQDWAIMGFRRSAKRKRRVLSPDKPRKKAKEQATPVSPIALSGDKSSDSDSDDDDDDDEPLGSQPRTDGGSPSRSRSDSPSGYRVDGDGVETQSPKGNSMPPLPRNETSFDRVDAIIQGSYIPCERHKFQVATERSDVSEPASDGPKTNFDTKSTAEIADAMSALMDGVATPNSTNPHSPSSDEDLEKLDHAKALDQPSVKPLTASVQSSSSSVADGEPTRNRDMTLEEQQHYGLGDSSRQAMRDTSEHAARTARAKQVAKHISSGILSQHYTTSNSSDAGTANASRQVSRDTLPDQPGSSFFEEAMAGSQTHSQPERDDDPRGLFDYSFSELLVSERERSSTSASQEQPSSYCQHSHNVSDGVDHRRPTDTANTGQPVQQQPSESHAILPGSTDTEGQGNGAG